MFEKPQYFTKDGFKRLPGNPYKTPELEKRLALLKKEKISAGRLLTNRNPLKKTGISDEAATLIANVLKGMLGNSRK
ncbi:MAG TPA: hypothetical protein DCO75_11640 [Fibrobacteres bacterium]|jgi:hypothetical protein|nr:hypothetical protein [Fibrobacterota bacterium]